MSAEPGWCSVCGLPVPGEETVCRWRGVARADDDRYDDEAVPWRSHSLAFMTELVELQCWRCPWCADELPNSPRGTAIDHIIPRIYGGPHRRWNLQLLHAGCNSAKGSQITAEALDLADAHDVTIGMNVEQYRSGVRRRAVTYALRASRPLGAEARGRALVAARNLTVFFPEGKVHAAIRAAIQPPPS
jgi:5-methylcytosine-specific restriction endonuclease McrA